MTSISTEQAPRRSPRAARGRAMIPLDYRPLWSIADALIGKEPGVVFLDSGGGSPLARWSLLGWNPRRVVAWPQGRAGALDCLRACVGDTRVRQPGPDPSAVFDRDPRPHAGRLGLPPPTGQAEPPFFGGWVGWFSYDLGRHIERLPSIARLDATVPDFVIGEYDLVLAEDHARGALWVAGRCASVGDEQRLRVGAEQALRAADRANARPERSVADEDGAPGSATSGVRVDPGGPLESPRPLIGRAAYRRRVEAILRHIRDGDIYQANFSHRFTARTAQPSRAVYRRLRDAGPAPFACYMDLPGGPEILSASPELFVRKTGARLQTRPIKGTRPRDADASIDAKLRRELEASEKERAELLMITDLLRNDLGRVAEYGSVVVASLRELESFATVHHAYSVIDAQLRRDLDVVDVIAATIPGGSVTGAPKIRAMEILERLEPARRGPYTGAAGFIGDDGDMCLNILIRTLVRRGQEIWYQVGGGIVADSDPDAEYEETLAKGAALRRALEQTP